MEEKEVGLAKVSGSEPNKRPTITVPPRSFESIFIGGSGFSPGPMTLLSNFHDSDSPSFSQLLAGAMASPLAAAANSSFLSENSGSPASADGSETNLGYKQKRPMAMNLVVAHSPVFVVPPALSPSGLLNWPGFFSPKSPFGMSHQQALAHVTAQAALSQTFKHIEAEYQTSLVASAESLPTQHSSLAPCAAAQQQNHSPSSDPEDSKMESSDVSQSDSKLPSTSRVSDKLAGDGYNWRKYGQKQVKASECLRSYYKCTHLNCHVKKIVERSHDGQITEITYRGQHNHEQPQPCKRLKDSSKMERTISSQTNPECILQVQTVNNSLSESLPSHLVTENGQACSLVTTMQLAKSSDHEEVENVGVRQSEGDVDEPNKSRKVEAGAFEPIPSQQTVAEPKIVLHTRSEVDLLDDGYKWRKYGQKVVKGNPNPRSYYRCTYTGCNVRKHVERASTDPKAVVTTYEGKHNHGVPISSAKNSNNVTPMVVPCK